MQPVTAFMATSIQALSGLLVLVACGDAVAAYASRPSRDGSELPLTRPAEGVGQHHTGNRITVLHGARVAAAARASIAGSMPAGSARALKAVAIPPGLRLPPGKVRLHPRPSPAAAVSRDALRVWVEIFVDDRLFRVVPVVFSISRSAAAHATADGESSGRRSSVAPVSSIPAIHRGQWINLRTQTGTVVLETRAQALQDGHVGQRVKARVAHSAAPVHAWILSSTLLELRE